MYYLCTTINSSPILRFLPQQTTDNVVSGQINILGTLANPSVSVRVSNASLNLQGENLEIQCFASLDDKVLEGESCGGSVRQARVRFCDVGQSRDPGLSLG